MAPAQQNSYLRRLEKTRGGSHSKSLLGTLGIKSQAEKDAEKMFQFITDFRQTKEYVAHTKVLLDDLTAKIDVAVAVGDTATVEQLRSDYKKHDEHYEKCNRFFRDTERRMSSRPGDILASGFLDIFREFEKIFPR